MTLPCGKRKVEIEHSDTDFVEQKSNEVVATTARRTPSERCCVSARAQKKHTQQQRMNVNAVLRA